MKPQDIEKLKDELIKVFSAEKVEAEKLTLTPGRYRLAVVSPRFSKMSHLKRQEKVWEVVDQMLTEEDALDITMILAYAPEEVK